MSQSKPSRSRAGLLLTTGILVLTAVTAMVHLSLGGIMFLLNGLGYLGLAGMMIVANAVDHPLVHRYAWFPRLALIGYAGVTIVGYLIIGLYSTLGWATKVVEFGLIVLLAVDLLRLYGSPRGVLRQMVASVVGRS